MKYDSLFDLWYDKMKRDPQWEYVFVFGLDRTHSESKKPIIRKINSLKAFQKKLIKLCGDYGFDILKPNYLQYTQNIIDPGKLTSGLAERLKAINLEINSSIQSFSNEVAPGGNIDIINKTLKPGKTSKPHFILSHILVGIGLMYENTEDLKKFRKFFETGRIPTDEKSSPDKIDLAFDQFIKNNTQNPSYLNQIKSTIFGHTGEKSLNNWCGFQKQSAERSLLSAMLKKDVKSIKEHPLEITKIRRKIDKEVAAYHKLFKLSQVDQKN